MQRAEKDEFRTKGFQHIKALGIIEGKGFVVRDSKTHLRLLFCIFPCRKKHLLRQGQWRGFCCNSSERRKIDRMRCCFPHLLYDITLFVLLGRQKPQVTLRHLQRVVAAHRP